MGLNRNFLTEDKSPDLFSVFFEVTEVNDSVIMAASFGRVCSRGLSSSASLSQLVKTPTPVYGTEGRYAAALYSAASKNKALEAVEKDLKTMTATSLHSSLTHQSRRTSKPTALLVLATS